MTTNNKLWLLTIQDDDGYYTSIETWCKEHNTWFDTYRDVTEIAVLAATELDARALAVQACVDEDSRDYGAWWGLPALTRCIEIGWATPKVVLCQRGTG